MPVPINAIDLKRTGLGSLLLIRKVTPGAAATTQLDTTPCTLDITIHGDFKLYGCMTSFDPPGVEWDTVVEETCLDSVGDAATSIGEQQPDEINVTRVFDNNGTQTQQLATWAKAGQQLQFAFIFPDGCWVTFCGQIRVFDPQTVSAKEFMKVAMTFLRNGDFMFDCPVSTGVPAAPFKSVVVA